MGRIAQALLHIAGVALDAIAIAGVQGSVTAWIQHKGAADLISDPYVAVALMVVGNALIAGVWAQWISSWRLKRIGGETGREFPARLRNWDKVPKFTTWQMAWLWNDLEPQDSDQKAEGTAAYPTFRKIKEDLDGNLIKGAAKQNNSWMWATLDRQQIIDYCLTIGERPKFIFVHERKNFLWRIRRLAYWMHVPFNKDLVHKKMSDLHQEMYRIEHAAGTVHNGTIREIEEEILFHLRYGRLKAAGRRKIDGFLWDYEKIPRFFWWSAELRYPATAININKEYHDVIITKGLWDNGTQ